MNEPILIRAMRGEKTERTPIWLMRQAGRFLPEYRKIREKRSILEIIAQPELAAEVTLQPVNRFGVDAAIIFADILPPLQGMGLSLSFAKGEGPVISNPLRTAHDIDLLAVPPSREILSSTLDAIRLVKAELQSRNVPVIGFAGAPFTLASYAIEGGTSRNFARTKCLMYTDPAAWNRLMTKLVTIQSDFLLAQADAGAAALQVFDSWVGAALGLTDYRRFVEPFNRRLFEQLGKAGVPIVNFSTGTGAYIEAIAQTGGDVVSVDWRLPLSQMWERIGYHRAIQGNLDPVALLAPWRELEYQAEILLKDAAGRPGHIFNLGHGVLPETPVDNVKRLVEFVHESTNRGR